MQTNFLDLLVAVINILVHIKQILIILKVIIIEIINNKTFCIFEKKKRAYFFINRTQIIQQIKS